MRNEEQETVKAYVIYEATIRELCQKAQGPDPYTLSTLAEFEIKRDNLTDEQKKAQLTNKWHTDRTAYVSASTDTIYDITKDIMFSEITNGQKSDLRKIAHDKVMDSKVKVVACFSTDKTNGTTRVYLDSVFPSESTHRYKYDYVYDMPGFLKELRSVCDIVKEYGTNVETTIYLEKVSVFMRGYTFEDVDKIINKVMNKIMREDLTYCIKGGRVIIPDEYIKKGVSGIQEWRQIKKSNNKNNSIEKQMIKQIFADKKKFANDTMCRVMYNIRDNMRRWDIPVLSVDGQYNKAKTAKLVNEVLNTKNRQEIIEMSEDEIVKKIKKYWADELAKAITAVNTLIID